MRVYVYTLTVCNYDLIQYENIIHGQPLKSLLKKNKKCSVCGLQLGSYMSQIKMLINSGHRFLNPHVVKCQVNAAVVTMQRRCMSKRPGPVAGTHILPGGRRRRWSWLCRFRSHLVSGTRHRGRIPLLCVCSHQLKDRQTDREMVRAHLRRKAGTGGVSSQLGSLAACVLYHRKGKKSPTSIYRNRIMNEPTMNAHRLESG